MEAFGWAVERGAEWIETDVRCTADSEVVCLHDPDGIQGMTAEEARGKGIPTLAEAMDAFPEHPFNIDLKDHSTRMGVCLARLLAERGWEQRVRVASFSGRAIRRFRRLTGHRVRTSAAEDEVALAWVLSRLGLPVPGARYDALQVPARNRGLTVVDRRFVDSAHRGGKVVHVWTVNDSSEAVRLVGLGVDGIITDRVDEIAAALAGQR